MRKRYLNLKRMGQTVQKTLQQNQQIWASSEGFTALVTELNTLLANIEATESVTSDNSTGIAVDKEDLHVDLIDSLMEVVGPMKAYATKTKNNELKAKVNFSRSEFHNMPEDELRDKAKAIAEYATAHADELAKFEITTDEISELSTLTSQYASIIDEPRKAITTRSAAHQTQKEQFSALSHFFEDQLDPLMDRYHRKAPEFFNAYHNSRLVVDYGTRHEKDTEATTSTATSK